MCRPLALVCKRNSLTTIMSFQADKNACIYNVLKILIVICVGESKAPPVLYSSYRTVFDRTVLYDGRQGEGSRTSLFQGLPSSPAQPGEPQNVFANCFNPLTSAKIGRSILTLAAPAWCNDESPTSTINLL